MHTRTHPSFSNLHALFLPVIINQDRSGARETKQAHAPDVRNMYNIFMHTHTINQAQKVGPCIGPLIIGSVAS